MVKRIIIVVVLASLVFVAITRIQLSPAHANAPDTIMPTVYSFSNSDVVVQWTIRPPGFQGVSGKIYLESIDGFKQEIVLEPFGDTQWYNGYFSVPSGFYWLTYGFFEKDGVVYSIEGELLYQPHYITRNFIYVPALRK